MIQSNKNGLFAIQQVADMTGLSKQVIRKWEERYGVIQPKRLENGYRVYRQEDVKTLLKMKLLSEQGHSLKQAALLVKEVGENPEVPTLKGKGESLHYEQWNEYVLLLLEKGRHCDEVEINFILKQAYHHVGLDQFLTNIVVPFLKEVGRKWETHEWDEYQESVSSLVVRDFLVQIRRNYQYRESAPFALGACLPYEHHEVPLHLILLRFMLKGWKTQLIGASPAPGAIESLISRLKPNVVLLSATTTIPFETDPQLLQKLDQFAEKQNDIAFYLGGQGSVNYISDYKPRAIRVTNSLEDILK
ncbi:MerR family transcriptional regulator [Oceanobacillus chungangensis]|uniref:MarR family transcriptional regulator n=1 Tax=Oceanobacillus chungangensis TaxID=1229152 RepID=A0A3D8PNQ6_9BACI|nr:MerR family transcriptional regulator [Oceanobacillus chungangensis]RDW16889.1 MarR family transcriptional regulator [Oceanobacillus chungangensis]